MKRKLGEKNNAKKNEPERNIAHHLCATLNVDDQAYWNVATKRLVDNVCMTMEQDFVVKLLGKVESELFLLTNRFTEVEELFVEVGSDH